MIKSKLPYRFLLLLIATALIQPAYAQSDATTEYSVKFTGNWTLESTPGGVVSSAHFTTIAGGKHNSSVSFWSSGGTATSGLESLAELGATNGFINEINASSHTDASFTSGVSGGGTGTSTFTLTVKKTHPLITLASMIGPSPDWFVGLHDYSLLDSSNNWVSSITVNLYPYDAGTEDGTEFTLSNPATSPRGVITSLRNTGKFSDKPMATISFTRNVQTPTGPTITAIERANDASQHTNANSVTWEVTFSEAVQNVSTDDFVVNNTTATATSASLKSGSTTAYEITASGGDLASLNSEISLGLASSQNITNSSNEALQTTLPTTNESYIIDNSAPRVLSVSPSEAETSPFTVSITFSEAMQAGSFSSTDDVTSDDAEVSAPNGSGSTYNVTVTPNDPTQTSMITLRIPAGAGTDLAGNGSAAHEAEIEYVPEVQITPPSVNSVSAVTSDGLYHTGDELEIVVTFSQTVTVTGTPTLSLQFDSGTKDAPYDNGSGTTELTFAYTLVAGDAATDLDYASSQSLNLNGASINGPEGQAADLTLPAPGTSGSLSQRSDITTSGRQDAMPSFGNSNINDQVLMMNQRVDAIELPSATGGDLPLEYSLQPSLPAGLQLDGTTHVISGTPTVEFDRTRFTWIATDTDGDTVTLTFSIMVLPELPLQFPSSASIANQIFLQNDEIDFVELPAARGGVGDLTYMLTPDLPEGLMLDVETREIAGTPAEAMSATTFTWSVMDDEGETVSLTFSITVLEDLQPVFNASSIDTDQIYIQDSEITSIVLPSATSGNGELTYTLDPELPDGLVFDNVSFEITGTPTTPHTRTPFVWQVSDEDGDVASFNFYVTVLEDVMPAFAQDIRIPESQFITDSAVDAIQLPSAMGGNGSLTYKLTPMLPGGLSLDENSREISGTPIEAIQRTEFTWSVEDEDGDSSAITFFITVIQDTQPMFSEQIADKVLIVDTPIESFTLPDATGGNGDLTYELTPELPTGLNLDKSAATIDGTPTMETPAATYSWKVTDVDSDMATLSFTIVVQPAAPMVIGSIPNVSLVLGGGAQTINARSVVEGTVSSWQVNATDPSVATVSVTSAGTLTLTPQIEGQTNVTLSATNVTDSVEFNFSVSVVTDAAESEQIDTALAMNAGAILSGAMNVFKKRSHLHDESSNGGASALRFTSQSKLNDPSWTTQDNEWIGNLTDPLGFDFPSTYGNPSHAYGNDFGPMNFTHTTTKWSLWGAVDLQNFSGEADSNEIDGSLSSVYVGADLAINQNAFVGLAFATHSASSSYEFASMDADGEGEIDISLTGIYPYLQAGNGNRFSMFLVGGFGSGDAEIDRRHANGLEPSSDADLSLFVGGFDYVVMRRPSIDLAIVGDAGVATISTVGDSGALANRERSSSKSSIGSSVSFNRQVEGGSLVTSADIRLATGADDDESGTGFELGANLNYFGENVDFMLDGRTTSRSGDTDTQRSSLSARLRYKANADGSGLTLAIHPKWQNAASLAFDDLIDRSSQFSDLAPLSINYVRSVEGEIGYGILMNNESTLFNPRLTWQRFSAHDTVLKLGSRWRLGRATRSVPVFGFELTRNSSVTHGSSYGFAARVEMPM